MTTEDFITDLFCRVDDRMENVPNHPQAALWPSELVTIGLLFAVKGVGQQAFYRWLSRDFGPLFPALTERTRLFRRLKTHWKWAQMFLAEPSLLGVIDSYGVEPVHPVRKGRNPKGWAEPGVSNHRWIVGGKLCLALNHLGQIIGWAWATANAHDTWFHPLVEAFQDRCVMLADTGFHAAEGGPAQPEDLPQRPLERQDAGGNRLFHARRRLPHQEDEAPGGRLFPVPLGHGGGGLQPVDRLGRVACARQWLRSPVHCRVQPVT